MRKCTSHGASAVSQPPRYDPLVDPLTAPDHIAALLITDPETGKKVRHYGELVHGQIPRLMPKQTEVMDQISSAIEATSIPSSQLENLGDLEALRDGRQPNPECKAWDVFQNPARAGITGLLRSGGGEK
jgi:hypothetical protein